MVMVMVMVMVIPVKGDMYGDGDSDPPVKLFKALQVKTRFCSCLGFCSLHVSLATHFVSLVLADRDFEVRRVSD